MELGGCRVILGENDMVLGGVWWELCVITVVLRGISVIPVDAEVVDIP